MGTDPFYYFFPRLELPPIPEDKYLAKASEIKKKRYRNTEFVGIGYGNDFAQNSYGWAKLKKISEAVNQTKENVINILGTKLQAIQRAENHE